MPAVFCLIRDANIGRVHSPAQTARRGRPPRWQRKSATTPPKLAGAASRPGRLRTSPSRGSPRSREISGRRLPPGSPSGMRPQPSFSRRKARLGHCVAAPLIDPDRILEAGRERHASKRFGPATAPLTKYLAPHAFTDHGFVRTKRCGPAPPPGMAQPHAAHHAVCGVASNQWLPPGGGQRPASSLNRGMGQTSINDQQPGLPAVSGRSR